MFFIFIRACKKYEFSYELSTHNELVLKLRPNNAFESIEIKQKYYKKSYFELFLDAIKEMKTYRKRCVH